MATDMCALRLRSSAAAFRSPPEINAQDFNLLGLRFCLELHRVISCVLYREFFNYRDRAELMQGSRIGKHASGVNRVNVRTCWPIGSWEKSEISTLMARQKQ